ncbi:MAG: isoprenylcysteine carboxylmethyltransferase family protein [Candidatus Eisenbacteria bacterium]|nr:isoprenylcysteine carboxylmethyltransferase family protein [Candidatus Eisenbacteria bacterium]
MERGKGPGILVPPPVLFLAALSVGVVLQIHEPARLLGRAWLGRLAGAALIVLGIFLSGSVMRRFGEARTPVTPWRPTRALVVTGPYRFSRNPDYLGQTLLYCGIALAANSAPILAMAVPALLLVNFVIIPKEERYLEGRFAEEYRSYRKRVRRWL